MPAAVTIITTIIAVIICMQLNMIAVVENPLPVRFEFDLEIITDATIPKISAIGLKPSNDKTKDVTCAHI